MIGETIKDFKITGRLGKGGMGEVWVAEQQIIKTKVAIKLLLGDVSTDKQQVQRFFNEAIAVSKIKHAGIVKIYDVGFHASGRAYLIMELLEGETLAARIHRAGRLPIGQIADLGKQIASVLAATHAAGITHRDLKPDNIFLVGDAELASRERARILDFGIAKLGASSSISGMTGTGNSMGTPAYMAPEQWNDASKADARADVYSLGCVAFEMCCGRPPFVPTSIGEACSKHLHDAPPRIRSIVPELPLELDALVDRMLAKNPADRPTMIEVGVVFAALGIGEPGALDPTMPPSAITRAAAHRPLTPAPLPVTTLGGAAVSAERPASGPRRRTGFLAVGALVAIAGGGAVYLASRGHEEVATPPIGPVSPSKPVAVAPAGEPTATVPAMANPFVVIAPSTVAVTLGIDREDAPADTRGFRPSRKIQAPTTAYAIQEHEVTWSELEPWLAAHDVKVAYPPWATSGKLRAELPATAVAWSTALAYCQSLGGSLPTEEQWEFAARGAERRPNPWGPEQLDPAFNRIYGGTSAIPAAAKANQQDQTPALADGHHLYDLAGNVQEWTSNPWREDKPGSDERWVLSGETSIRTIRGLPLGVAMPSTVQPEAAAYRDRLCATGPCDDKSADKLRFVGFRCAKAAVAAAIAPPHPVPPKPVRAAPPAELPVVNRTMINEGVAKVKAKAMACGDKSSATGTVKVNVTVASDGSVVGVAVMSTPDPELGACVAAAVKHAVFPRTQGSFTFGFPFVF